MQKLAIQSLFILGANLFTFLSFGFSNSHSEDEFGAGFTRATTTD